MTMRIETPTREWKPGDVAMVVCSDGKERPAIAVSTSWGSTEWVFATNGRRGMKSHARSLVVIDPDDAEQVKRLAHCYIDANPNTVFIKEPTGLGAVVEDAHGHKFVRVAVVFDGWAKDREWQRIGGEINAVRNFGWDDINVVRVLSEGVTS